VLIGFGKDGCEDYKQGFGMHTLDRKGLRTHRENVVCHPRMSLYSGNRVGHHICRQETDSTYV
jgi:hypothetical protein